MLELISTQSMEHHVVQHIYSNFQSHCKIGSIKKIPSLKATHHVKELFLIKSQLSIHWLDLLDHKGYHSKSTKGIVNQLNCTLKLERNVSVINILRSKIRLSAVGKCCTFWFHKNVNYQFTRTQKPRIKSLLVTFNTIFFISSSGL